MEELFFRVWYLLANAIAVGFLVFIAPPEWVAPTIGIWILAELNMVQRKQEKQNGSDVQKKQDCGSMPNVP